EAGHHVGLGHADRARAVLLHPRVTAAVLEADEAGVLREGLGFDACDVAVVAGAAAEEIARVLVGAVSHHGAAVLDAADARASALASACPGSVVYFARREDEAVTAQLARHGPPVAV